MPASSRVLRPTALIGLRLHPGAEEEYRAWQRRITLAAVQREGYRGMELFEPVPGAALAGMATVFAALQVGRSR